MNSAEVDEVKRHFNVVAERLEGRIQLLADGLLTLDERVGDDSPTLSAK